MQDWCQFREMIIKWSKLLISDQEFYDYLVNSEFDGANRRVADLFIKQHDGNEWTHSIYHRGKI